MFGMPECPFFKSSTACSDNPDCLFRRSGGCAVVLGATIADDNRKKLEEVERKLNDIINRISNVEFVVRQNR